MNTSPERNLYSTDLGYWLNTLLFPVKMIIPQPVIAKVPCLTTNEQIRRGLVLALVKGRLLDIGCGPNRLVLDYRERGGDGTGVDVYPWDGVDMVVEDTSKLPFDDGSVDTVTFVACLNHIPNRLEVLREARRVLRADGRVLLTNLPPVISRIWHAWAFWDEDQHERGMEEGEVFGFTRAELRDLTREAGFEIESVLPFSWRLNRLYALRKASG